MLKTSEWYGSRDVHATYPDGEYVASCDWVYTRVLQSSLEHHMRVLLKVVIHGKSLPDTRDGYDTLPKSRPRYFSASLHLGLATTVVATGTCGSIKQALAKVDACDLTPWILTMVRKESSRYHAETVFRVQEDGSLDPFLSLLRFCEHNLCLLPSGNYVTYAWSHSSRYESRLAPCRRDVQVSGGGYVSSSHRELPTFPVNVLENLPVSDPKNYESEYLKFQEETRYPKPYVLGVPRRPRVQLFDLF